MGKHKAAPLVDYVLAETLSSRPDPVERLMKDQGLPFFLNAISDIKPKFDQRVVRLECGHFVFSRARNRTTCCRCGEMIRSGYDYVAFRAGEKEDDFHWPDDPLRNLNDNERG